MNYIAQLYRDLFRQTNGFMLTWPFGRSINVGDFFALRYSNIGVVGNIYESYFQLDIKDTFSKDIYKFSAPVLEPYVLEESEYEVFKPHQNIWNLKGGCHTNYFSDKLVHEHKKKWVPPDVNIYRTQFALPGSYFFNANEVSYIRMSHFKDIHKELIRRLTTEFYNFSKIFVVTEVAHVKEFSLGVSKEVGAEVVISRNDYFNGDVPDIIKTDEDYTVERVRGMDEFMLRHPGGTIAFRAKKMGLSLKARDTLIKEIYASSDKEMRKYAVELIDNELFHLFPKIEINPGNANEFFEWGDLSLEDVEDFLGSTFFK